jgi:GT2 family glycosyltransferase
LPTFISVVIPTHNRPEQLEACLAALSESTQPRESFEVVVVDDGGTAQLAEAIEAHGDALQIHLSRQDRAGPAAARNRGAALARGELLVFTDDDCLPEPDWLPALARRAETRPSHLIGGRTINALPDNPFSSASQNLVSYLYEYSAKQADRPGWSGFFTSNNLAVPVEGFAQVGGFDERFPLAAGEDRDFCDRWVAQDLPMTFAADARIRHAHRLGFASFIRQQWNYGRGAHHFRESRLRRGASPLRPQPLSFYLNLLRYPYRGGTTPKATVEAALLAASQGMNALGYLYEKHRKQ